MLVDTATQTRDDVIVIDTPPSCSAMDFLHAPSRLLRFLESGAIQAFLSPTRRAARAAGLVFAALRRIIGVGLLDKLTAFFQALTKVIEGFRSGASDIDGFLRDADSGFLVITESRHARVPRQAN